MEAVSSYAAMGCGLRIVSANAIRPADNSPFGGHWCLTRRVLLCLCPMRLGFWTLLSYHKFLKKQEQNETITEILLYFILLSDPPTRF